MSKHHILPRSRLRSKKTVTLPDAFHKAWHILFQNLKPNEIESFIVKINFMMATRNSISQDEIDKIIESLK